MSKAMRDYRFINKDPVIDIIRFGIEETKMDIAELSDKACVSVQTIHNWLHGKVKRPQNITADCVLMILGITRTATWTATGEIVRSPAATGQRLRVIAGGAKR